LQPSCLRSARLRRVNSSVGLPQECRSMIKRILITCLIITIVAPSSWTKNTGRVNEWHKEVTKLLREHPWVSVELISGEKIEGKLISLSTGSFVVDVNKKSVVIVFEDVANIKKIRGPEKELIWTFTVAGIALILLAIVYKDYT
jgi:hypothetical protein